MESSDGAIEAEIQLDGQALEQEQSRRKESAGKKNAEIAQPGVSKSIYRDDREEAVDEESPLLTREQHDEPDSPPPPWLEEDEFAHLPWHKRPSIFWIIAPFFLVACAFGGIITPKINLILELVCQKYFQERMLLDPGFTMVPVDFRGGENDQCRIPEVQSGVSMMMLWIGVLSGVAAAASSPKLGALSDRYGRKIVLIMTSFGMIGSEAIYICAATWPETFPVYLLLLAAVIDGLTGSFILAGAIVNAYAADCTPPARRNIVFAWFHACLFTGIAIGPILAGYIVKATGQIVVVFWILTGVHFVFIAFIALAVPESLSKKRQMIAREKHESAVSSYSHDGPPSDWIDTLRAMNPFEPLKVLWPTGPGSSTALRRNLFFLAAVDTICFGVAMGSMVVVIAYSNYMFGWTTFESGRFLTIVNSSRVFCLLVILPTITRLVRGRPAKTGLRKSTGCDNFDLSVVRAAVFMDTLGYVGFSLARSGGVLTLAGAVAAVGGIASPTLQSSLTKHIPADRTGQLLGATSLLHAVARVIAPAVFNGIYAGTVKNFPQTVFVCLASTFGLAFLISWFVKPHGELLALANVCVWHLANRSVQYSSMKSGLHKLRLMAVMRCMANMDMGNGCRLLGRCWDCLRPSMLGCEDVGRHDTCTMPGSVMIWCNL